MPTAHADGACRRRLPVDAAGADGGDGVGRALHVGLHRGVGGAPAAARSHLAAALSHLACCSSLTRSHLALPLAALPLGPRGACRQAPVFGGVIDSHGESRAPHVARCALHVARCTLRVARYTLRVHVAFCMLRAARCMLRVARCALRVARCALRVARCALHVARCTLRVARCALHVARCTLHVARYTLRVHVAF